jgi:hypothetical protein
MALGNILAIICILCLFNITQARYNVVRAFDNFSTKEEDKFPDGGSYE